MKKKVKSKVVAKKPVKKSAVKTKKKIALPKAKNKPGKLVGKVTHYFSDIKVAVVKLSAPLAQGDQIRIIGGEDTDFSQKVASLQFDHEQIKKAKKGVAVGLKVAKKAREGYKIYKV